MAAQPNASNGVTGVAFPAVDGGRSTSATGRAVLADAARAVDGGLAATVEREREWRKAYPTHVRALVEAELRSDTGGTAVPRAGLESLHRRFVFAREGRDLPLEQAIAHPTTELGTARVQGRGAHESDLAVPYRGRELRGDVLHRQLDRWTEAGTLEPSFAEAVRLVMDNPDWRDLSDRTFVLLGAGAEMGPVASLAAWGAELTLVDLPREALWGRLLTTVHESAGTASIPLQRPVPEPEDLDDLSAAAGADLFTEAPEISAWLEAVGGPVTVGNYVYADGADNVRVSMAADAIISRLCERDEVSVAVLATPTDVYAAPEEAVVDSMARFADSGGISRIARTVSRGRVYAPNYGGLVTTPGGHRYGIADCLVSQQGPNYALAKRLHRWRARLARDQGHIVSANVAPATTTRSVTKNRVLAAAYAGAPKFGVEVFEPATSNTLMAALLVHDLRNPKAAGHPDVVLPHPLDLFAQQAGHGGMWRNPFAPRSVLTMAALLGLAKRS